jgi:hypothetical protein
MTGNAEPSQQSTTASIPVVSPQAEVNLHPALAVANSIAREEGLDFLPDDALPFLKGHGITPKPKEPEPAKAEEKAEAATKEESSEEQDEKGKQNTAKPKGDAESPEHEADVAEDTEAPMDDDDRKDIALKARRRGIPQKAVDAMTTDELRKLLERDQAKDSRIGKLQHELSIAKKAQEVAAADAAEEDATRPVVASSKTPKVDAAKLLKPVLDELSPAAQAAFTAFIESQAQERKQLLEAVEQYGAMAKQVAAAQGRTVVERVRADLETAYPDLVEDDIFSEVLEMADELLATKKYGGNIEGAVRAAAHLRAMDSPKTVVAKDERLEQARAKRSSTQVAPAKNGKQPNNRLDIQQSSRKKYEALVAGGTNDDDALNAVMNSLMQ